MDMMRPIIAAGLLAAAIGGGIGDYYYFNKDTSLLVGPVWFNDKDINGQIKWTAQIDINL